MNEEQRNALAKPFDPRLIRQKPGQGGRKMSYISHAIITERLSEVDPNWTFRPIATYTYADPNTGRLHCEGVEVELTVCGVSRVEAGGPTRQDGFPNEIKNAYSDAIKRAAMRFGVGLSMWDSLVDAEFDDDYDDAPPQRPLQATSAPVRNGSAPARVQTPPTPQSALQRDPDDDLPEYVPQAQARRPVPPPSPNITDENQMDRILNDTLDKDARLTSLSHFFGMAKDEQDLSARMVTVARSGLPLDDRKHAFAEAHARLSRRDAALAAPAFASVNG